MNGLQTKSIEAMAIALPISVRSDFLLTTFDCVVSSRRLSSSATFEAGTSATTWCSYTLSFTPIQTNACESTALYVAMRKPMMLHIVTTRQAILCNSFTGPHSKWVVNIDLEPYVGSDDATHVAATDKTAANVREAPRDPCAVLVNT